MEYEIEWAGDAESLTVTTSGRVTVEALDEWVQTVLADSRYRSGVRILIDHRRSDWAHMTPKDAQRRVDLLARDAERIGSPRIAFVVSRKVDFGVARMMELYIGVRWQAVWRVFDDIDDARAWLWEAG
ncbi:MAG: STAS/SEC14 domain-containing protein [Gaiellaceae bacterium]